MNRNHSLDLQDCILGLNEMNLYSYFSGKPILSISDVYNILLLIISLTLRLKKCLNDLLTKLLCNELSSQNKRFLVAKV